MENGNININNKPFPITTFGNGKPLSKNILEWTEKGEKTKSMLRDCGLASQPFYCSAFTLIELLIVVLIIGILASIAVPQYQTAVIKSRATNMLPLLQAIANSEERYYFANGRYALSASLLDLEMPGSCPATSTLGTSWKCGDDFLFDFWGVGTGVSVLYCPDNNDGYTSCNPNKDFELRYAFQNTNKSDAGKIVCQSRTSLGEKICKGLPISSAS